MKHFSLFVLVFCAFLTLGAGCPQFGVLGLPVLENMTTSTHSVPLLNQGVNQNTQVITGQSTPVNPGVPASPQNLQDSGPWNGSVFLATSSDGDTFTEQSTVVDRAGVPNILKLHDGTLVLTYQYFSAEASDMFDVIAYSLSFDQGETWTAPAPVHFSGLPLSNGGRHAMDPDLVQLDDGRLRMYVTYHADTAARPTLYVATASDADMTSTFMAEPTPALSIADTNVLDPSVIFFHSEWHHYSWLDDSSENIHTTSSDGLTFTQRDSINLPMDFLGQVIAMGDGLRFFGTGSGKILSAFSTDGYTWVMDDGFRLDRGADPGVTQLDDGTYLMVYTSQNFNR